VPGPWRIELRLCGQSRANSAATTRGNQAAEAEDSEVVRRDVSVWFIGPASGYPEWVFRNGDGTIEIVKEPRP